MNRYIKIKGHENWFLCVSPDTEVDEDLLHDRMQTKVTADVLNNPIMSDYERHLRLNLMASHRPDYNAFAQKYAEEGTVIVRPSGSWMLLYKDKQQDITDERYGDDFPSEAPADIVVCENDENADPQWLAYLSHFFPMSTIKVINFFGTRTVKNIRQEFEGCKYITFSTTFTTTEWYEKLLEARTDQKIIGYTHNADREGLITSQENAMCVPFEAFNDFRGFN